MKLQVFTCLHCEQTFERPMTRGNYPRWCSTCKPKQYRADVICKGCGNKGVSARAEYCSRQCSGIARRKPESQATAALPRDLRSPLRKAYEDQDWTAVIEAVRSDSDIAEGDCWIWRRRLRDGYPEVRIAQRYVAVHRLVLEARLGVSLGSQAAHHMCGSSQCVNPDHLQPVTHRENAAEMLARHSYLRRIRDLEAALAAVAPDHLLLTSVAPVT